MRTILTKIKQICLLGLTCALCTKNALLKSYKITHTDVKPINEDGHEIKKEIAQQTKDSLINEPQALPTRKDRKQARKISNKEVYAQKRNARLMLALIKDNKNFVLHTKTCLNIVQKELHENTLTKPILIKDIQLCCELIQALIIDMMQFKSELSALGGQVNNTTNSEALIRFTQRWSESLDKNPDLLELTQVMQKLFMIFDYRTAEFRSLVDSNQRLIKKAQTARKNGKLNKKQFLLLEAFDNLSLQISLK